MSHITIAASAHAFEELFNALRNGLQFAKSGSGDFGPFSASYNLALHLEGGSLQLNNDNTVEVQDLKIVFTVLKLTICLDIPQWCIGGECVIPDPWNGCLVSLPKICVPPVIGGKHCVDLDLSGLVSRIADLKANLLPVYFVDPARQPGWSDLDAELNGHPNKWKIFVDPVWVHVDPIDLPASAGNVFENLVKQAIADMIPSWVPGWAVDWLWSVIGPVVDLIKSILGIVGEISDWIADLLNSQFDLLGLIETAVADYFASQHPIYELEDPYPILDAGIGLIPVNIPIRDLTAEVNANEMIVLANVGA